MKKWPKIAHKTTVLGFFQKLGPENQRASAHPAFDEFRISGQEDLFDRAHGDPLEEGSSV